MNPGIQKKDRAEVTFTILTRCRYVRWTPKRVFKHMAFGMTSRMIKDVIIH
jgi:hypothetical protein